MHSGTFAKKNKLIQMHEEALPLWTHYYVAKCRTVENEFGNFNND